MSDKLDIFEIPDDTRVIVTVEALRELYQEGYTDAEYAYQYGTAEKFEKATIKGEIV